MANLIINVRCTCEEEFLLLHKLHKLYQEDQLRKRLKDRLVAVQGNGDGTKSYTVKCEEPSNTFDEKPLQQAVDGGVDALGNPPLPEANGQLISEFAVGDRAEDFHCPTEPTHFAFEEEPVPDSMWKKPEITLTDVLEAEALEKAEAEDEGWNGGDHNFCA